jgi:hypothetical protein
MAEISPERGAGISFGCDINGVLDQKVDIFLQQYVDICQHKYSRCCAARGYDGAIPKDNKEIS